MLKDLVKGRKLQNPLKEIETAILIRIQYILEDGDHDSADRMMWTQTVLALRELEDLRKKK